MSSEKNDQIVTNQPEAEPYERPELTEFGTLQELTLSGSAPLSDSFGGAAGGGS
jgi:hypothetical protein